MKLIYCPAHKGIMDNEFADNLAKIASKSSALLSLKTDISLSKVKEVNKQITLNIWCIRWEHSQQYVSTLCNNSLKQRFLQFTLATRKDHQKFCNLKMVAVFWNNKKSNYIQTYNKKNVMYVYQMRHTYSLSYWPFANLLPKETVS